MALERKLNKMRSFTLPKLSNSTQSEGPDNKMPSFAGGHSRESSSASSASSPVTSAFSTRSHSRWPSSCSSLASAPDSPVNAPKATLEDLVEEAAERDDFEGSSEQDFIEEPFCICDTPFCEHRQRLPMTPLSSVSPEWSRGDDLAYNYDRPQQPRMKRSSSTEFAGSLLGSRRQQRWHSLSSRWHSRRPTLSVTSQTVRSAPPTPGSSSRRPSASQSLINSLDPRQTVFRSDSEYDLHLEGSWIIPGMASSDNVNGLEAVRSKDPIDREGLSSTPLLPHLLTNLRDREDASVQSPLQSPTVATRSETASLANVSICSPLPSGLLTPPLSAKPSMTSMGIRPPFDHSAEDSDEWAMRLGHADFHIEPRPYHPQICTPDSCRRLLKEWESARVEYMRIIARVSEHYGPSSPTYKLTEQKWAEIDREWRNSFEHANAEVSANGETPISQCLAETQPLTKMPSLVDPNQPAKFLDVKETDIVGPMVQYIKIQQPSSPKRTGFFGMLNESASSLFGRSVFASKR